MRMTSIAWAATALLLASSAASAQQSQGYVGASFGATHFNVDCAGVTSCDRSDTGGKIYGGFKFTPNLAAELIYHDYGRVSGADASVVPPISASFRGRGFGIGLAYWADFTPTVNGVVRLGVARNRIKASATQSGLSVSDRETSTRPYIGLAVGYKFTPQLSADLSLDFTRFRYGGETNNARMVGLGLTYGF